MAVEVKVPAVGESVQEGMIGSWHKKSGEWVNADEVLLELETDKATVEVAAAASGKLDILLPKGEVVKVGQVIARIETQAQKSAADEPKKDAKSPSAQAVKKPTPAKTSPSTDEIAPLPEENGPAVRRMLAEHTVDTRTIFGSGRGGRLTKGDLLPHLSVPSEKDSAAKPSQMPSHEEGKKQQEAAKGLQLSPQERQVERKPMSMLRRRIAERLLSAQSQAAILTTFNEVDMTAVMDLRKRYQDDFQKRYGLKLGFMGFFLQASVAALKAFPEVNAYIEGHELVYHSYCDIGVAVSTDKGLMVPILRNADKLSLAEMELAIAGYAQKARENKISLDDLSGGTFTVSNGGVFGSLLSTPILNPPQSAILGMHKTQNRPMVMSDGAIQARPMMYLALSYDHRIIDGKEAVGFLVKIKEVIEDPSRLLLGV